MCYLPLAIVRQNFLQIYDSRTVNRLIRRWPQLWDFIVYRPTRLIYVDGSFAPTLWNCYDRNAMARTNNFAESK